MVKPWALESQKLLDEQRAQESELSSVLTIFADNEVRSGLPRIQHVPWIEFIQTLEKDDLEVEQERRSVLDQGGVFSSSVKAAADGDNDTKTLMKIARDIERHKERLARLFDGLREREEQLSANLESLYQTMALFDLEPTGISMETNTVPSTSPDIHSDHAETAEPTTVQAGQISEHSKGQKNESIKGTDGHTFLSTEHYGPSVVSSSDQDNNMMWKCPASLLMEAVYRGELDSSSFDTNQSLLDLVAELTRIDELEGLPYGRFEKEDFMVFQKVYHQTVTGSALVVPKASLKESKRSERGDAKSPEIVELSLPSPLTPTEHDRLIQRLQVALPHLPLSVLFYHISWFGDLGGVLCRRSIRNWAIGLSKSLRQKAKEMESTKGQQSESEQSSSNWNGPSPARREELALWRRQRQEAKERELLAKQEADESAKLERALAYAIRKQEHLQRQPMMTPAREPRSSSRPSVGFGRVAPPPVPAGQKITSGEIARKASEGVEAFKRRHEQLVQKQKELEDWKLRRRGKDYPELQKEIMSSSSVFSSIDEAPPKPPIDRPTVASSVNVKPVNSWRHRHTELLMRPAKEAPVTSISSGARGRTATFGSSTVGLVRIKAVPAWRKGL